MIAVDDQSTCGVCSGMERDDSGSGLSVSCGIATLGLLAFAAFIMALLALTLGRYWALQTAHVDFSIKTYKVNVTGICAPFLLDVVAQRTGRQVALQIPYFTCDGTVNRPDSAMGNLHFPLPDDIKTSLFFSVNGTSLWPWPEEHTTWVSSPDFITPSPPVIGGVGSPSPVATPRCGVNDPRCKGGGFGSSVVVTLTFNITDSFIADDNHVYMGMDSLTWTLVPGTHTSGPWYGFTIVYYTDTTPTVPVVSAATSTPSTIPMALAAGAMALLAP